MITTLRHRVGRWVLGTLGLAFGCSLWAAWAGGGCHSCAGAGELLRGTNLALLGVLYYTLLLTASLVGAPRGWVTGGVALAAGLHLGLGALLVQARILCLPCIATAAAAGAALVAALSADPASLLRASVLLPGAALAVQSWALVLGGSPAIPSVPVCAEPAPQDPGVSVPPKTGRARMVLYTRPDCGYCIQLERDILPALVRKFGPRLTIERRSAQSLPGIPTPTILLSGSEHQRFFPGLPPREDLERAIALVIGDANDAATLPQESR